MAISFFYFCKRRSIKCCLCLVFFFGEVFLFRSQLGKMLLRQYLEEFLMFVLQYFLQSVLSNKLLNLLLWFLTGNFELLNRLADERKILLFFRRRLLLSFFGCIQRRRILHQRRNLVVMLQRVFLSYLNQIREWILMIIKK